MLFVVARWRDFFSNFAGSTLRIERVTVTRVRLRDRASSGVATTDICTFFCRLRSACDLLLINSNNNKIDYNVRNDGTGTTGDSGKE